MTCVKIIIFILIIASGLSAQDGTRIQRHKFYKTKFDSENIKKFIRKRPVADIDSTGYKISLWDDCSFSVKLRNKDDNMNHYRTGTFNGQPYIKYGNNKYRYRMYINSHGQFEFDAEIRNKPASGRYFFPFNIKSTGLTFFYIDTLSDADLIEYDKDRPSWHPGGDKSEYLPDSVIGSYVVRRSDNKRNRRNIYSDEARTILVGVEDYTTSKAFSLSKPIVFDNNNDTIDGFIEIDTVLGRMIIGADSTWMANAVYPVTFDPHYGFENLGTGSTFLAAYARLNLLDIYVYDVGSGVSEQIDSIFIGMFDYSGGSPWGSVTMSLYGTSTSGTNRTGGALFSGTTSGLITTSSGTIAWYGYGYPSPPIVVSDTTYSAAFYANNLDGKTGTDLGSGRFWGQSDAGNQVFPDPWSQSGTQNLNFSHYFVISTIVADGDEINPRRRKILLRGYYEEDNYNSTVFADISDWR